MDHQEKQRSKCQICNRSFSNRKALGGHMKSHFVKAPLAGTTATHPPPPDGFQIVSQQSRNLYMSDHMHNSSSVYIDKSFSNETSNDCTASPPPPPPEAQSYVVSATTSTCPEEDAARCLVMLSRGIWNNDLVVPFNNNYAHDDCNGYQIEDEEEEEETLAYYMSSADEEEEEEESSFIIKSSQSSTYKCETCNKEFKSYQALGGHRSSHSNSNNLANNHRIFKCSYCPRVFDSGQALGGHKKVHTMCPKNNNNNSNSNSIHHHPPIIDLNIPLQDRSEFNHNKFDSSSTFISYDDSLLH